jgi:membrane protein implicated in regulation of membrane protease activity
MANGTETAPAPDAESSQPALLEVVKGLRNQPPLLFGIGAGIVLIGVLAATTSIVLVVIVAAVLVAALAAWLVRATRSRTTREGRATVKTNVVRAKIKDDAEVAVIEDSRGKGTAEVDVNAKHAEIGGRAVVGRIGGARPRRRRRG